MRVSDTPMPPNIAALPRNKAGYPVPWFVATIDGTPDFRVIESGKIRDALRFSLCFTCGQHMGVHGSFVIGPMCAINRVSAEPPSHRDCAIYAAKACPFLATPDMVRRPNRLPDLKTTPGIPILRNPGVALVWTSRTWTVEHTGEHGLLFAVGNPTATYWFAEGREATRAEVLHSIDTGLPTLRAAAEIDGPRGLTMMEQDIERALALVPAS